MCFSSVIWFSTYASVRCLLKLYHCCSGMPRRKWFCSSVSEEAHGRRAMQKRKGRLEVREGQMRTDYTFMVALVPWRDGQALETWWPEEGHLSRGLSLGNPQGFIAIAVNGFICQRLQDLVNHLKVWAGEGGCYLRTVYQQEVFIVVEYYVVRKSALLLAPAFPLQLERYFRMQGVSVIRPSNAQLERKQS